MRDTGKEEKRLRILRAVMLVLGAVFTVLGILRSEHLEVLEKAVRICLDCMGIG